MLVSIIAIRSGTIFSGFGDALSFSYGCLISVTVNIMLSVPHNSAYCHPTPCHLFADGSGLSSMLYVPLKEQKEQLSRDRLTWIVHIGDT